MTVGRRIHGVVSGFSHEKIPPSTSCPAPVQFAGALATDKEAKLLSDSRLPGTCCYGHHPSWNSLNSEFLESSPLGGRIDFKVLGGDPPPLTFQGSSGGGPPPLTYEVPCLFLVYFYLFFSSKFSNPSPLVPPPPPPSCYPRVPLHALPPSPPLPPLLIPYSSFPRSPPPWFLTIPFRGPPPSPPLPPLLSSIYLSSYLPTKCCPCHAKSAPWPPNISHEHVFCTAPATRNAS